MSDAAAENRFRKTSSLAPTKTAYRIRVTSPPLTAAFQITVEGYYSEDELFLIAESINETSASTLSSD
jgi:hypothetical protein